MQPSRQTLGIVMLTALLASTVTMSASAEDGADNEPQPVTIIDPAIPTDQLELLLKPLTKDQLLVEADAWRSLVQAKAEEIVQAEIAIKLQNQEIAVAAEVEKQAKQAKEDLAEVTEQVEQARQTGDTEAVDADTSGAALQDTAEAMSGVKAAKNDEKVALLEQIAELREERTQLLDQLKAVLAALEAKTPESDSATLAKIQDYQLYATAVHLNGKPLRAGKRERIAAEALSRFLADANKLRELRPTVSPQISPRH